jgi:hypothetical protein
LVSVPLLCCPHCCVSYCRHLDVASYSPSACSWLYHQLCKSRSSDRYVCDHRLPIDITEHDEIDTLLKSSYISLLDGHSVSFCCSIGGQAYNWPRDTGLNNCTRASRASKSSKSVVAMYQSCKKHFDARLGTSEIWTPEGAAGRHRAEHFRSKRTRPNHNHQRPFLPLHSIVSHFETAD